MRIPKVFSIQDLNLSVSALNETHSQYRYLMNVGVHQWKITTYGLPNGHSGPIKLCTEVYFDGRLGHKRCYDNMADATTAHVALFGLCSLAESLDELLLFLKKAEAYVPGSENPL